MCNEMYDYNPSNLTDREKILLSFLFSSSNTEEDINTLTCGLNIDKENENYILLLSCLGLKTDWQYFPKNIIANLEAIHKFRQAKNIFKINWLIEKIKILNQANISVMLLKGLALKYYYAKDYPRIMSDFDIAVPEEKYDKAIKLLVDDKSIYSGRSAAYHSEIESDGRRLEVHRWIFKNNGEKNTDIWERSQQINFFGTKVYVMCPQDMFIHQLDNRCKDIFNGVFRNRRINWIFDCRNIYRFFDKFDIQEMYSRAEQFCSLYSVRYMLPALSEIFPDLIDKTEIETKFPYPQKYNLWLKRNIRFGNLFIQYTENYVIKSNIGTVRLIDAILLNFSHYFVWRTEKFLSPFNFGFIKYCKENLNIDDIVEVWKKYISRLQIFNK